MIRTRLASWRIADPHDAHGPLNVSEAASRAFRPGDLSLLAWSRRRRR